MQVIIHPDGDGLAVTNVAPGIDAAAFASTMPGEKFVVEASSLPDYYFRPAWKLEAGAAVIDIEGAKEVQRERWRARRVYLLEALDVQFMRALEDGDAEEQSRIVAEKQALREVTDTELPDDPAAIKETWPEILGPQP